MNAAAVVAQAIIAYIISIGTENPEAATEIMDGFVVVSDTNEIISFHRYCDHAHNAAVAFCQEHHASCRWNSVKGFINAARYNND